MELDILASRLDKVNFAPATEVEEIIQNVKTICTTTKYSVPLDRQFGINTEFLDRPTPKAMAAIQAELIQAVRKYEPRCKVTKIFFDGDSDGKLNMKVRIRLND
ncbi:MAG: GPW/gp25 family protein [Synergistaceae bacterium]|nr:GPW/gp25 family protein [Synergistaceae bacterium]